MSCRAKMSSAKHEWGMERNSAWEDLLVSRSGSRNRKNISRLRTKMHCFLSCDFATSHMHNDSCNNNLCAIVPYATHFLRISTFRTLALCSFYSTFSRLYTRTNEIMLSSSFEHKSYAQRSNEQLREFVTAIDCEIVTRILLCAVNDLWY